MRVEITLDQSTLKRMDRLLTALNAGRYAKSPMTRNQYISRAVRDAIWRDMALEGPSVETDRSDHDE